MAPGGDLSPNALSLDVGMTRNRQLSAGLGLAFGTGTGDDVSQLFSPKRAPAAQLVGAGGRAGLGPALRSCW